jgi:raffinose/stachyose/melibiose transport system substrate-binding protein
LQFCSRKDGKLVTKNRDKQGGLRMRKMIALALVLTFCIPALAIAGGAGEVKSATIQVLLNQTWNKPSLEPMARNYEKLNPGIKVDLQVVPDEQFPQLLNTRVATKEVPDIVMYNFGQLKQYFNVPNTFVALGQEPWVSRLVNPNTVSVDGAVYGLPMNAMGALIGVFYNKQLFEQNNLQIPKTRAEFLALCKKIQGLGKTPVAMTAKDGWTVVMWVVNLFPNAIADNKDIWSKINVGKAKFSDYPEFENALSAIKELVDNKYVNDDYLSAVYDNAVQRVASGEAAMVLQGDWFAADVTKKYPEAKIGVFPYPLTDKPRLGHGFVQTYSILKDSKNADASKKFLRYLAEVKQMTQTDQDWNCVPGLKDVTITLPYYVQGGLDNFINNPAYGLPYPDMGMNIVIEIDEMINLSQAMVAGSLTPKQVLAQWDQHFAAQAKARKLAGWN